MTKNSSNSSKGDLGNTSQISPSKHWMLTLNNYTEEELRCILKIDSSIVPRYVGTQEVGEEKGTPHIHFYICFTTKKRPMSVWRNDRIHWDKIVATKNKSLKMRINDVIKYCSKEHTRMQGTEPFYRGIQRPFVVEIENMYDWQKEIITLIKGPISDRALYWFWEPEGCSGKTTLQKYIFTHFENVLIVSGKASDMKYAVVDHLAKTGLYPTIILANIPRTSMNYISYAGIEDVKDMFFHSSKYEGGQICGPSPHFLLFANERPVLESVSLDRWMIKEI